MSVARGRNYFKGDPLNDQHTLSYEPCVHNGQCSGFSEHGSYEHISVFYLGKDIPVHIIHKAAAYIQAESAAVFSAAV